MGGIDTKNTSYLLNVFNVFNYPFMKFNHISIWTLLFLGVACGCKKNKTIYFPNVGFEQYVYLNNPSSFPLTSPGGHLLMEGGYRGLIIYRRTLNGNSSDFGVYDRACPEHYDEDCSVLDISDDGLFAVCPCHGEEYLLLDGSPSGNAKLPLHPYPAILNGDVLYISN